MGSAVIFGISCLLLPVIAFAVINQDWQFEVAALNIVYKPWRLFFIVCALPGLFSHLAMLYLPESPKFVLGQGKTAEAIDILQMIHRWNNGKETTLDIVELCDEGETNEMRQRTFGMPKSRMSVIKSIWMQTAPLFKPPYIGTTTLLCLIQFFIYYTSNGLVKSGIFPKQF